MKRKAGVEPLKMMLVLWLFSILSVGCSKKFPEIKWADENPIGNNSAKMSQDNIAIDIYIDATTSMAGFAVGEGTAYSQFIDQLEASALSAWKSADIKYFKFGERIKKVDRNEFLSAKNKLAFYRENGIFKKTYIDSVVKNTDNQRLSVLITDLFQDEGDVNIMVDQIKSKCFNKNVMLGLLGIKTEFKGKVFDTPNNPAGYQLDSKERPFYALVFGDPSRMETLFEALKTKDFVKEEQILLISNQIMKTANVSIVKTKDSKFVNKKGSDRQIENAFDFSMKSDGNEAKFNYELTFDKNSRCVDFDEKTINLIVYKKSITDLKGSNPDSVPTNDIKIENIQKQGNKLTATLVLKNEDPVGNFSYLIYFQPNSINGFILPTWIKDFSTDNPMPNSPTGSLTYNLEKLVSRLIVAKNSIAPTCVSKSILYIYKR
jgi:hypothetical protein